MQKLTLPIVVGKKYVRRDGEVITAQTTGDSDTVDVGGGNNVWKENGQIWRGDFAGHTSQTDLVADYIEPATAHTHAKLMMEYAKDAASMAEPWKNWENKSKLSGLWVNCGCHPGWSAEREYRRKQPKVTINGIECVAGVKEPEYGGLYYVSSVTRTEYTWAVNYRDCHREYVERGLLHHTAEDAVAMAKAMLSFK